MEGSGDLDDALRRRHEAAEATGAREKGTARELTVAREGFEREEAAARTDLYAMVDQAIAKLRRHQPDQLPVGPKPQGLGALIRHQQFVEGWQVDLGGDGCLLSPDGTLTGASGCSNLRQWVEAGLRSTHDGPFTEAPTSSPWGEAFSPTCRLEGHRDRAGAQASMRARLAARKKELVEDLAGALYQCGVRT